MMKQTNKWMGLGRRVALIGISVCCIGLFSGCLPEEEEEDNNSGGGDNSAVVGTWIDDFGAIVVFDSDGTVSINDEGAVWNGTYTASGSAVNVVISTFDDEFQETLTATIVGTVSGNTMSGNITFSVAGQVIDTESFSATKQ